MPTWPTTALDRHRHREGHRAESLFQLGREKLRQAIAEKYNIPVSERSRRILEDVESVEARHDFQRDAVVFQTQVHGVTAREGRPLYRDPPGRFQWSNYAPSSRPTSYVMSTQGTVNYMPTRMDYYVPTTSSTSIIWDTWNASNTSTASQTFSYAYTNQQYYVQQPTWVTWQTQPFNVNRGVMMAPPIRRGGDRDADGNMWDQTEQDFIDPAQYYINQAVREEAANALREENARLVLVRNEERAMADQRAESLLQSILTPAQAERYARDGIVEVTTPSGRLMHLQKGWAGNALELDRHTLRRVRRYCIHPRNTVPVGDNLAAQLLLLQTDEELFFQVANASMV